MANTRVKTAMLTISARLALMRVREGKTGGDRIGGESGIISGWRKLCPQYTHFGCRDDMILEQLGHFLTWATGTSHRGQSATSGRTRARQIIHMENGSTLFLNFSLAVVSTSMMCRAP